MNDAAPASAILLIYCPDRKGLVAAVAEFVQNHGGNILELEQHVDRELGVFFMRVEWDLSGFDISTHHIGAKFETETGQQYGMKWSLHFTGQLQRMAVFVSRLPHCLYDLLSRWKSGEWRVEVPLVVSNHPDLEPVARQFGVEFAHFPITRENKAEQEQRQIALLKKHRVDLVVLARYMQIVGPELIAEHRNRIINIHHSFLPAFPGAKPYHSAHARGVKIIGVTSHYVTEELDAGPIIEQDVVRVSHRDAVEDFIRHGRDLEKVVLSRAIWAHLRRQVLVYENRTVVFD